MATDFSKLLVVDDDPSVRDLIVSFASRLGYEVDAVESGEDALAAIRSRRPDLVTLDVVLPGIDGVETLKAIKQIDRGVPVVMLSGYGQTHTIVEAVKQGASDFLRKPFEPEELELALKKALQKKQLEREVALLRDRTSPADADGSPFLFGDNRRMREIYEVIEHVADTDVTVLIRGESGTGKELVARTLFERSGRRSAPFVKVNCAALPAELLESELFGFEKGAFTGAQRRKLGKFEAANGGTIFLDEISEMHPNLQAKLLQVLQDGRFSRLGGEGDVQVDARVIAATNRNLESAVRQGQFREDLFYRLNVVAIQIPPLRERTPFPAALRGGVRSRAASDVRRRDRGVHALPLARQRPGAREPGQAPGRARHRGAGPAGDRGALRAGAAAHELDGARARALPARRGGAREPQAHRPRGRPVR
jgi:two-component system response regulator AtoC